MKNIIVLLAAVMVLVVSGCATVYKDAGAVSGAILSNEGTLQTTLTLAAAEYNQAHPAGMAKITAMLTSAQAAIKAGTLVTAADVRRYIGNQIADSNLTPLEINAAGLELAAMQGVIVSWFNSRGITSAKDQLVEVDKVLTWILAAVKVS